MVDRRSKLLHPDRLLSIGIVFAAVGILVLSLIAFPLTPAQAAPPTLTAISAGGEHTCVLTSDGRVLCAGNNTSGQLGSGTTTRPNALWPITLSNPPTVTFTAVSAGDAHTCAIDSDKKVWCWGRNNRGQLGKGDTNDADQPVLITTLTNVTAISAGHEHTCAVKDDGTAWCWGRGTAGRLGTGNTSDSNVPVQVSNLTNVTMISAGGQHTCARTTTNEVWCWGNGASGRLGTGNTNNSNIPVKVNLNVDFQQTTSGGEHTCAHTTANEAWCWGLGNKGQIGNNTTTLTNSSPQKVSGNHQFTAISASGFIGTGQGGHTCAIRNDGSAWCWGLNTYSQLGDATTNNRNIPVGVRDPEAPDDPDRQLTGVIAISTGRNHTCAIRMINNVRSVWCWGLNDQGQLADDTTTNRTFPTQAKVAEPPQLINATPPNSVYGVASYSYTFTASGYPSNLIRFNVTAGSLPPGLTLNDTTGVLAGQPTQAGTYNFTITVSNGIAPDATKNLTITIAKAPLTVRADDKSRVYGDANPSLTYTITGFVNNDPPTIVTGTPALSTSATATTGVGQLPILITQGTLATNNNNYNFTFANGTLTINRRSLTVKADNKSKTYGTANPSLTYTATGLINNDQLTGSLATTATTNSAVGSYPITQGTLANNNYTITFTPGTLTINKAPLTVTANDQTRTYGAANPPLTFNAEGFVAGDTANTALTGSLTTTATTTSPVGSYDITQGTLAATNYTISFTNGNLTIARAPLTATADNQVRKVGRPNPEFTISYSGFVNNETPDVLTEPVIASTDADENSPPGEYPIVLSGGAATNYELTLVNGMLRVVEKDVPIITWSVPSLTYGMPLSDAELNATASFNDEPLAGEFTYNPPVGTVLNAGTGLTLTVLFTPTDQLNFEAVGKQVTIDVKPAPLTITADDKTMVAGGEVPALTAQFEGLVNNDTEDSFDPPLTLTTEATSSSPPGTYPIVPGGAANPNYDITFVNGTLTIRPAGPVLEPRNGNRGKPGSYFVFVAQGFEPDEQVRVAVNGAVVLTLQVDSEGKLIFVLFFPPNAQPGVYTISVMSVAQTVASDAARMAETEITLVADAPVLPAPDDATLPRASGLPTVFLPLIVR